MADRKGYVVGFGEAVSTSLLAGQAMRRTPARRRKKKTTARKKTARRAAPRRRAAAKGGKPARMVKGSPAAKRHMAKLRRMRKT